MVSRKKRILIDFAIPLILLAVASVLFLLSNLDIETERLFFDEAKGEFDKESQPWALMYRAAPILPIAICIAGFAGLIGSFFILRLARLRRICIFNVLVMLVGPGLIINSVLKDYLGLNLWARDWMNDPSAFRHPVPITADTYDRRQASAICRHARSAARSLNLPW